MGLCLGVDLPEQNRWMGPGIGMDPGPMRDFVQGVEGMGYEFVGVGDHVLGAETINRPEWQGRYDRHMPWHDALCALSYLAGVTRRIGLMASVVVLPQRQTVLVAKQAAAVDILSEGRLYLGVGVGWNQVEFEALGQDFSNRGKRIEEQLAVLRALWTQEVVTFNGQWHRITEAGLNPLPVQRPIPIWFGGHADSVVRRVGRLADGWIPAMNKHGPKWLEQSLEQVRSDALASGRDPSSISVKIHLDVTKVAPEKWLEEVASWQALGVTHISASTRRSRLTTVDEHLKALERFKKEVTPLQVS